jgi:hypothetical protein
MQWRRVGESRDRCTFLDFGTQWRWMVSFKLRSFYLEGNRSWVGPRVSMNAVEKRKLLPCWKSNEGHPARNPSLNLLNLFTVIGEVCFKRNIASFEWIRAPNLYSFIQLSDPFPSVLSNSTDSDNISHYCYVCNWKIANKSPSDRKPNVICNYISCSRRNSVDGSFQPHYGPGEWESGIFLGVKRCRRVTLTTWEPIVYIMRDPVRLTTL